MELTGTTSETVPEPVADRRRGIDWDSLYYWSVGVLVVATAYDLGARAARRRYGAALARSEEQLRMAVAELSVRTLITTPREEPGDAVPETEKGDDGE